MSSGAFDLGSYGAEIVIDDAQFTAGMENAEKKIDSVDKKSSGFASKLGTVATGAIAGLGVALVGAAVAGVHMSDELQQALNGLQASTGSSSEEMKGMEQSLKNIYANNFGEDFKDIADSMALVKQNTGLTGKELETTTQNALALRDTFEFEVGESTNAANSLMKQFGITSDQAFNLIAQGAQNGANKNGDLIDSLNEYAPQFKAMGFSAEEFTNVLIDGAKNGSFSIDKVGDAMKEFNIRSKDMSATSMDAFKSLGMNGEQMSQSFAKGGESAQKSFIQVMTALNNIKDPVEKNRIGVELFGTQFEDLEAKGIASLANIGHTASLSKDALGEINKVKYNTFGEAMTGIGRNLQLGLIDPMKKYVLPVMAEFATWLTAHMPQIQAVMSSVFNAIGGAISGFITVVRKIISTFRDTESSSNSSFSKMSATISSILGTIKGIISDVTSAIRVIWKKYGDDIMRYVKSSMDNIMQIISGIITVVRGVIKTVLSLITGDWKGAWNGIKMIFSGAWNVIQGLVKQVMNSMKATIGTYMALIGNVFKSVWNGIKAAISSVVSSIYSTVSSKFSSMKSSVSSIFNSIWSTATSIFGRIKSAITSPIESAKNTVLGIVSKLKSAFNFSWKLPSLKLPHVSIDMKKNSVGIPYPDFNVKWYANGGFFDQPELAVLGDGGKEAAVPLVGSRMNPFADAVYNRLKNNMSDNGQTSHITLNNSITFNVKNATDQNELKKASKFVFGQIAKGFKERGHKF